MPPFDPRPARHPRPAGAMALLAWTMVLLAGAMAGATAHAQSIGDWNGTYRAPTTAAPTTAAPSTPPGTATHRGRHRDHPAPRETRHGHNRAQAAISSTQSTPPPPAPAPAPALTPAPTPALTPPPPRPAPPPAERKPAPPPAKPASLRPPTPGQAQDLPQWPLGLAAMLGGAAGWALWRRKSAPQSAVPQPREQVSPPRAPLSVPQSAPLPESPPALAPPLPELRLDFMATRFATTLTEAILRYELTVTNHSGQALGPLVLAGAMEAAGDGDGQNAEEETAHPAPAFHATSFPPAPGFSPHPLFTPEQVTPGPQAPARQPPEPPAPLPELYRLAQLQSGESATLQGQFRLPLSEITPIRLGGATLFVPLIRVEADAIGLHDDMLIAAQLCVMVGEATQPSDQGRQAGLGPFRLDAGPMVAPHVATRRVNAPKAPGTPLDIAV